MVRLRSTFSSICLLRSPGEDMRKCVFNSMFEHGVLCSNIKRFMFKHKTLCSNIQFYVQTYNSLFEQTVGTCGKCGFNSMFEHRVLCLNINLGLWPICLSWTLKKCFLSAFLPDGTLSLNGYRPRVPISGRFDLNPWYFRRRSEFPISSMINKRLPTFSVIDLRGSDRYRTLR